MILSLFFWKVVVLVVEWWWCWWCWWNVLILGLCSGCVGFFSFQKSSSWVKRPSLFLHVHGTSQKSYYTWVSGPLCPALAGCSLQPSALLCGWPPILRPFHDLILKTNGFWVHFVRLCLLDFLSNTNVTAPFASQYAWKSLKP